MMDRETTIEYMKRAVACNKTMWDKCKKHECHDCQYDYPVSTIEIIESALKLLEAEEEA